MKTDRVGNMRRARLMLQALEDRAVPAIITVNTTADNMTMDGNKFNSKFLRDRAMQRQKCPRTAFDGLISCK